MEPLPPQTCSADPTTFAALEELESTASPWGGELLLPLILTILAQLIVAGFRWWQDWQRTATASAPEPAATRSIGVQVAALATSEHDRQTARVVRELRSGLREAGVLDLPPRYDDEELYRFLCAAKPTGNLVAAIEMVQADLEWREARPASRGPTEAASAPISGRVMLRGLDLRGRPCMVIRLDAQVWAEPQPFVDELLQALEEHFAGVWRLGGPSSVVVILDLQHLIPARLPLVAARDLVRTLRAHYPQRAAAIHVVNLPPVLRWALGWLCSLLDSRTARKVRVHAEADAGLSEHFHRSQLLADYGGEIRVRASFSACADAASPSASAASSAASCATAALAASASTAEADRPAPAALAGPSPPPAPALAATATATATAAPAPAPAQSSERRPHPPPPPAPPSVSSPPPLPASPSRARRDASPLPRSLARNGRRGGDGAAGGAARRTVRLVWSAMDEREAALVAQLRARCAAADIALGAPAEEALEPQSDRACHGLRGLTRLLPTVR